MKAFNKDLLADLKQRVENVLVWAEGLKELSEADLNAREADDRWSVYECLEHLNRYGRFYLPEIENRIEAFDGEPSGTFKSTWLGEYFSQSMLPKEKLNTMKTFANMNPLGSSLGRETLDEFIEQQHRMLRVLHNASHVDLSRIKTSISISKLIRLRLGDTLRVVIYHEERHMVQANKVLEYVNSRSAVSA